MAQYKVPQDVEADDKLLGPFTFRQFVYLLITAGLIALAVWLFQVFPLLAIIPILPALLLLVLALPLKKDQPMETYLAAIVSFYLKPRTRIWNPGQRESTITITAPKIVETSRTRNISGEEATHRLSFLADIVDSEGRAINGSSPMRDDLAAEANNAVDMFDSYHFDNLKTTIRKDENDRHNELVEKMRQAIEKNGILEESTTPNKIFRHSDTFVIPNQTLGGDSSPASIPQSQMSSVVVQPTSVTQPAPRPVQPTPAPAPTPQPAPQPAPQPTPAPQPAAPTIIMPSKNMNNLANNKDFSVATIAQQANRIRKDEGETYISLH